MTENASTSNRHPMPTHATIQSTSYAHRFAEHRAAGLCSLLSQDKTSARLIEIACIRATFLCTITRSSLEVAGHVDMKHVHADVLHILFDLVSTFVPRECGALVISAGPIHKSPHQGPLSGLVIAVSSAVVTVLHTFKLLKKSFNLSRRKTARVPHRQIHS